MDDLVEDRLLLIPDPSGEGSQGRGQDVVPRYAAERSQEPIEGIGLLRPPGGYGAAIAVAEGKWTGGPLDFGGPLVGMFACQDVRTQHF